jgi:DNA repair exonuclease SbcCD ATPase subunit
VIPKGAAPLSEPRHDEFIELCALSTSGELSTEELKRLQAHLAVCPFCREIQKQYDAVVSEAIPKLAPEPAVVGDDLSWSQERAEASLFQRIAREDQNVPDRGMADRDSISKAMSRVPLSANQSSWQNVWLLCAAGVFLCVALGVSAFQVGMRRGVETAAVVDTPVQKQNQPDLEEQLSDAGHDREILREQISQRDKQIAVLRHQLEQHSAETEKLKATQTQIAEESKNSQSASQDLLQQKADLSQKLDAALTRSQSLQDKLDSLERQSSDDKQRNSTLEAKLADFNQLLHQRETTIDQQQTLLSDDRDIRELMGARDLYVVEVYDVEKSGKTRKPYGRMFYTKDKSVVFYAYDLDQQKGLQNASTFQAWGQRGSDRQQALNLGIFYVDNSSKKRWVLRFDDPKVLAQIDAVFVTVEPHGGSQKPTNKPLLFAYLHMDPNHP